MTSSSDQQWHEFNGNDKVARLIKLAGARPVPPAALEDSVRVAVVQAWRAAAVRRRSMRTRRQWLVASLGLLATGLSWVAVHHALESPPLIVGAIVGTRGEVQVTPNGDRALIVAGDTLAAGSRIETGPGGAALLTVGSVGIRIGPATVLGLERRGHIHLTRGQIYVDSGVTPHDNVLQVTTEFGSLMHLGTQYQVQVQPGRSMYTSVREGLVRVEAFGQAQTVAQGEGLRVSEDKTFTRSVVPAYGEQWQWVSDFVPAFSIDGRPLSVFLDWFARETGRTLTFVLPATRGIAEHTLLSGNITGLTPVQAIDAIMATTQFQYDVAIPGQLRVSVRTSRSVSMSWNAAHNAATAAPLH